MPVANTHHLYTEAQLETAVLDLLGQIAPQVYRGPDDSRSWFTGSDPQIQQLRTSEEEVLFKPDLFAYLRKAYPDLGFTDKGLNEIVTKLDGYNSTDAFADNKSTFTLIQKGYPFIRTKETSTKLKGAKNNHIYFIDFKNPKNNIVRVVRQISYSAKVTIRPDVVVYINGMPLIIFELKNTTSTSGLPEAWKQVCHERHGYVAKVPRLLKYNAFVVLSDGLNSRYGSHLAPLSAFSWWNRIDKAKETRPRTIERLLRGMFEPKRLFSLLENFIYFSEEATKTKGRVRQLKIICRYPQFYAATALYQNIIAQVTKAYGSDGGADGTKASAKNSAKSGRSSTHEGYIEGGYYWGTTGCGKTKCMVFLARMLLRSQELASLIDPPAIVVLVDRKDLAKQAQKEFLAASSFLNAKALCFESGTQLKQKLTGDNIQGIYVTTVQKFDDYQGQALSTQRNIVCISDEAHRSVLNLDTEHKLVTVTDELGNQAYAQKQTQGFAYRLHSALPNAIYVGFTGTPIEKTADVFGKCVDVYSMTDSTNDEITVELNYAHRQVRMVGQEVKIQEVSDQIAKKYDGEAYVEQLRKAGRQIVNYQAFLESSARIQGIAKDFVEHYENMVRQGISVQGKCLFTTNSRASAFKLYDAIVSLRPEWAKAKTLSETISEVNSETAQASSAMKGSATKASVAKSPLPYPAPADDSEPFPLINVVLSPSVDDEPRADKVDQKLASEAYQESLERAFKDDNSNFKIAIVVDKWLTGFDVPSLDLLYIDKPLVMQNLIQTISRVNRVYKFTKQVDGKSVEVEKQRGHIIDYIGLMANLTSALTKYATGKHDNPNVVTSEEAYHQFCLVLAELKNLFSAYPEQADVERLLALRAKLKGPGRTPDRAQDLLEQDFPTSRINQLLLGASDYIQANSSRQARFGKLVRALNTTYGASSSYELMDELHRGWRGWFLAVRTVISKSGSEQVDASEIVAEFHDAVEEALSFVEIKEGASMQLLGPDAQLLIQKRLDALKATPNHQIGFLQNAVNLALDKLQQKNPVRAWDFREKLQQLIDKYNQINERNEQVVAELLQELHQLYGQVALAEGQSDEHARLDSIQAVLERISRQYKFTYARAQLDALAREIVAKLDEYGDTKSWADDNMTKAFVEADVLVICDRYDFPPKSMTKQVARAEALLEQIVTEVVMSETTRASDV